jgi:hypothetical protein
MHAMHTFLFFWQNASLTNFIGRQRIKYYLFKSTNKWYRKRNESSGLNIQN